MKKERRRPFSLKKGKLKARQSLLKNDPITIKGCTKASTLVCTTESDPPLRPGHRNKGGGNYCAIKRIKEGRGAHPLGVPLKQSLFKVLTPPTT